MSNVPPMIQHKRCNSDSCTVCIMLNNDVLPWLERFKIYPNKDTDCSSLGIYFMGHASQSRWYNGSTTRVGHKKRQIKRFTIPETNSWMFQQQAAQVFNSCYDGCAICEFVQIFLNAKFWRMDLVLHVHEKHFVISIMRQYIPGLKYECFETSRDSIHN